MTAAVGTRSVREGRRRSSHCDKGVESILIVDDEESIRNLLLQILNPEGYRVTAAATGEEALCCLRNNPVDLLITDVKLPDIDGITLIRRAFEEAPTLLAVAITGYGSVDLAVQAMKAGASDFLTKPFPSDLVTITVKKLADLRCLQHENTVLKHSLIRSGGIRLNAVALADFANGGRVEGPDGLTDFERGLREGERRVVQREGAERERERVLLRTIIQRFEEAERALHETVEAEVNALAFAIATKVVRQTAGATRTIVLDQVRAALAHIHEGGTAQIRVHPLDVPIVETALPDLNQERRPSMTFTVIGESTVSPGGCLVQTAGRLVDATLEAQLMALGTRLRQEKRREVR